MVLLILCIFCYVEYCKSYRILSFLPFPATSHHNAFAPILHELARRGHHVVYLTPVEPRFTHPNMELRIIRPFIHIFKETMNLTYLGLAPKFLVPHIMSSTAEELAEYFYGDPLAQEIIHSSEHYDGIVMESYFLQEPVSALLHKFDCPAIEISSLGDLAWINELSGLPDNPAYQIDFKSRLTDSMTFGERLYNFYVTWSTTLVSYYYLWRMQSVMDKYFNYTGWESRPPINKLISNRSMVLINRELTVGTYPYPSGPHVKSIGGLNIIPNKPLPKDIQKFMDEARSGVIYFSLGSNLNTSAVGSGEIGKAFISAFGGIEQRVLMKWEGGGTDRLPANVITSKWFPQQDILAHNNCAVFITHGGYLSLTEAVYHKVPVLGIPFFGDQFKNLKQVETAGYGIQLDIDNVTTISVKWALKELISNTRYKQEAARRSEQMRDKRHSGLDEAVYWIEYAMKYPNTLTPRSTQLTFIQLHMIDIYCTITVSFIFTFLACKIVFKCMYNIILNFRGKNIKLKTL